MVGEGGDEYSPGIVPLTFGLDEICLNHLSMLFFFLRLFLKFV